MMNVGLVCQVCCPLLSAYFPKRKPTSHKFGPNISEVMITIHIYKVIVSSPIGREYNLYTPHPSSPMHILSIV